MLEWSERFGGTMLVVKAQPGARVNALRGLEAGALKVSVTQVAEKGKANQALRRLLSEALGVSLSQIELIQGELSSRKLFVFLNIQPAELQARLLAKLPPDA